MCSRVTDPNYILVADRAYGKHKQFDTYLEQEQRQHFVIRVRHNTFLHEPVYRDQKRPYEHMIEQDLTCQLGTKARLTRHRFRVVKLKDPQGNPVVLVTTLHRPFAAKIAEIYRQRWQIEVFFNGLNST